LREISFHEDAEGVWVVALVSGSRAQGAFERKRLILPVSGPDKDGWLAATVFTSALVEDFDKGEMLP
ncbi:hypothetical protein ACPXCX_46165, partial [Streptomyces sp. DT225]